MTAFGQQGQTPQLPSAAEPDPKHLGRREPSNQPEAGTTWRSTGRKVTFALSADRLATIRLAAASADVSVATYLRGMIAYADSLSPPAELIVSLESKMS